MSQTFDPAVVEALEIAVEHGPPLTDANFERKDQVRSLG
jgi:hypothetical protein